MSFAAFVVQTMAHTNNISIKGVRIYLCISLNKDEKTKSQTHNHFVVVVVLAIFNGDPGATYCDKDHALRTIHRIHLNCLGRDDGTPMNTFSRILPSAWTWKMITSIVHVSIFKLDLLVNVHNGEHLKNRPKIRSKFIA